MSWTASPGSRRGSVKTISDAIRSDGTAISRRFARYRFNTGGRNDRAPGSIAGGGGGAGGPFRGPPSPTGQPGRHQPTPVVITEAPRVVLPRALPDADVHARPQPDV